MSEKRKDYLNWNEFFMAIARLASKRSKDPSTQVGACIVGEDNRILSIGYNGAPNNFNDDKFPWGKENEDIHQNKYPYVCHAELNAILNFPGNRKDLINSILYVDLFPCNECAKAIIQSGIKNIIYLSDKYKNTDKNIASRRMFDECNIKYTKLENIQNEKIEILLK